MNKLGVGIIITTIVLLLGGGYFLTKPQESTQVPPRDTTEYEYFWGNGCPHCAKVQEFFDSWEKKDSVKINKREVWYNKMNQKIMEDRFNNCSPKPNSSQMAVPFMVTPDGKCLVGDTPIIELFKSL